MKKMILMTALLGSAQPILAAPLALTTIVQNDEKESLLADAFQRTLYVFDVDIGASTSKCTADCAEVWPPYLVDANEAKQLVNPLGTILRANNKLQLTYNGKPLYTFGFDRNLGDDKGDGVGGVWHYIEIANKTN